jgi:hypothetical protein
MKAIRTFMYLVTPVVEKTVKRKNKKGEGKKKQKRYDWVSSTMLGLKKQYKIFIPLRVPETGDSEGEEKTELCLIKVKRIST